MKKLLSLLTASCLIGSSSASVIACASGDPDKHLNDNKNSWQWWMPGLDKDHAKADSVDVWNELTPFYNGTGNTKAARNAQALDPNNWSSSIRQQIFLQMLKMINASVLVHAKSSITDSPFNPITGVSGYSSIFKSDLSTAWTNLLSSVNAEVQQKIQSYKDSDGKNWETKWKKFLKDSYDSSEDKYKVSLMVSSTKDNASTELTNMLLNYNQRSPETQNLFNIRDIAQNIPGITFSPQSSASFATSFDDWVKNNLESARLVALGYTPYKTIATKTTQSVEAPVWSADDENTLQISDINKYLRDAVTAQVLDPSTSQKWYTLITGKPYVSEVSTKSWNNDKKTWTTNWSSYNNGSNSDIKALASPFQTYVAKQWYKYEKPVAVSQYVFKYDKNWTQNLSIKMFTTPDNITKIFSPAELNDINTIINWSQPKGSEPTSWDNLSHNISIGTTAKPTYIKKLLTLDNSDVSTFPPEMKTAIYGGLSNVIQSANVSTPSTPTISQPTDKTKTNSNVYNFISSIQRTVPTSPTPPPVIDPSVNNKNNKLYGTFNIGATTSDAKTGIDNARMIAYLGDDGLHIIHIDGQDIFRNTPTTPTTPPIPGKYDLSPVQLQQEINKFKNVTNGKIKGLTDTDIVSDSGSKAPNYAFNTQIHNPYLQYLINKSFLISNNTPTDGPQFNVWSQIKSFAALSANTKVGSSVWYTWVYDFFKNYYTFYDTKKTQQGKTWFERFITLGGTEQQAQNYNQFFKAMDSEQNALISRDAIAKFSTDITTQNNTIKGKGVDYPRETFFQSFNGWNKWFTDSTSPNNSTYANFWNGDNWWTNKKGNQ